MSAAVRTALVAVLVVVAGCGGRSPQTIDGEKQAISTVIHDSIGWAVDKDKELCFGCFARDPELFWFSPRDDGTIHGFAQFVDQTENVFMRDEFRAIRSEIRDLKIGLSRSGDVAWFHCRLDDFNEWKGQPANWEDVRWTGVLEKRDGRWVIVQMHFSSPTDRRS